MDLYRKIISQLPENCEQRMQDLISGIIEALRMGTVEDDFTEPGVVYLGKRDIIRALEPVKKDSKEAFEKIARVRSGNPICTSPDGRLALLKEKGYDSRYLLADVSGTILCDFEIPEQWYGGGFSQNGRIIWFANRQNEERYLILSDTRPGKGLMTDLRLPEPCNPPVIAPDAGKIAFHSMLRNGRLWIVPVEGESGTMFDLKEACFDPIFFPDSTRIFIQSLENDGKCWILNCSDGTRQGFVLGNACCLPVFSSDGDWMVLHNPGNGPTVWIVDYSGNIRGELYIFEPYQTPVIAPDDSWILAANGSDGGNTYAFDPFGKLLWQKSIPEACYPARFPSNSEWVVLLSKKDNGHYWVIGRNGEHIGSWEEMGALSAEELGYIWGE